MSYLTMAVIYDIITYGVLALCAVGALLRWRRRRAERRADENRPQRSPQEHEALVHRLRDIAGITTSVERKR